MLEWRSTVRAVLTYSPRPARIRGPGFLAESPARVFVFKGAGFASKACKWPPEVVLCEARSEVDLLYTELECGPGSKVIGALTSIFSLNALPYTVAHRPLHPSTPPRVGAPSTLTED